MGFTFLKSHILEERDAHLILLTIQWVRLICNVPYMNRVVQERSTNLLFNAWHHLQYILLTVHWDWMVIMNEALGTMAATFILPYFKHLSLKVWWKRWNVSPDTSSHANSASGTSKVQSLIRMRCHFELHIYVILGAHQVRPLLEHICVQYDDRWWCLFSY